MSQSAPIAFFGATGGSVNAVLVLALKAGHNCSALARTPSKLTDLLLSKGISPEIISGRLQIIEGNVDNIEEVKSALLYKSQPVVQIISGIGMVMGTNWDSTICQRAARNILEAVEATHRNFKPFFVAISTTGITSGPRDVPIALVPLYHVALRTPHVDKRVLEKLIQDAARDGKISGFTLPRPTLLSNGKEISTKKIRVGSLEKPELGYTISRDNVGRWIFEELVQGDATRWNGQFPSLTS